MAVGEDLVKLKYTTASAVKEKEGKLKCEAEVLCRGKTKATQIDTQVIIIKVVHPRMGVIYSLITHKNCHFITIRF